MGANLNNIGSAFNGCTSLTNINVNCTVADGCTVDNFITNKNTTITFKQNTNRDSIQEILQGCPWQIEEIYDGLATTTETYTANVNTDISANIMEAESKTLELRGNALQNIITNPNNEEETSELVYNGNLQEHTLNHYETSKITIDDIRGYTYQDPINLISSKDVVRTIKSCTLLNGFEINYNFGSAFSDTVTVNSVSPIGNVVPNDNTEWIQLKPNTDYTVFMKLNTGSTSDVYYMKPNSDFVKTQGVITTDDSGKLLLLPGGNGYYYNLYLLEGAFPVTRNFDIYLGRIHCGGNPIIRNLFKEEYLARTPTTAEIDGEIWYVINGTVNESLPIESHPFAITSFPFKEGMNYRIVAEISCNTWCSTVVRGSDGADYGDGFGNIISKRNPTSIRFLTGGTTYIKNVRLYEIGVYNIPSDDYYLPNQEEYVFDIIKSNCSYNNFYNKFTLNGNGSPKVYGTPLDFVLKATSSYTNLDFSTNFYTERGKKYVFEFDAELLYGTVIEGQIPKIQLSYGTCEIPSSGHYSITFNESASKNASAKFTLTAATGNNIAYRIKNLIIYEEGAVHDFEYKHLYLPCQLQGHPQLETVINGTVTPNALKDKLYYDKDRGKWVIEKNYNVELLPSQPYSLTYQYTDNESYCNINYLIDNFITPPKAGVYYKSCVVEGTLPITYTYTPSSTDRCDYSCIFSSFVQVRMKTSQFTDSTPTLEEAKTLLNGRYVLYQIEPIIIETEYTDPNMFKFDTYVGNTYISSNSRIKPYINIESNGITRDCLLKGNTIYTVDFNIDNVATLDLGGTKTQVLPTETQKIITTPNTLAHSQLRIASTNVTADNLKVIEGDYSGENKINYFEGIENVGVWDDDKSAYRLKINTTPSTIGNIETIEGLSNYWVFNDYSKVNIYNDSDISQYFTVSPIVGNNVFTSNSTNAEARPYSTILSKSFTEDGFKDMTSTGYYQYDFWTEYPFSNDDEFTVCMSFSVEVNNMRNKQYFYPFAYSTDSNLVYFPDRVGWVEPTSKHSYSDFLKLNQMNSFIYVSTPNYCAFCLNGNLMASSTATRKDLSEFNKCLIKLDAQDKPTINSISFYKRVLSENEIINLANKYSTISTKTFYLPCQLNKVGDVTDRLYWDEAKGHYCIEKNIEKFTIDNVSKLDSYSGDFANLSINIKSGILICDKYIYVNWGSKKAPCISNYYGVGTTRIYDNAFFNKTLPEIFNLLNGTYFYYKLDTPEVIDLADYDINFGKLRLYGENTNIYTNGIVKPTAITFDHIEV